MRVERPRPSCRVAEFVHDILVIENCKVVTSFCLPLFANGKPGLLFQTAKGTIQNSSRYLTLFGQTVAPDTIIIDSDFTLVAYFFKPYALPALFGIKASELTDRPVDLSLLMPAASKSLQEALLHTETVQEMIDLIDRYIQKLIVNIKCNVAMLRHATAKIAAAPSKEILIATQKELYVTERTFQRLFETNIGVTPNQYRRIVQFDSAFNQLNKRRFGQLSDIAFTNNYADQSHFIRAFKEFTNLLPKQYLKFGRGDTAT